MQTISSFTYCCSGGAVYGKEYQLWNGTPAPLFRCDVVEKTWKKLPIDPVGPAVVAPLLNSEDGEADGHMIVHRDCIRLSDGIRLAERYMIQRHMFRYVPFFVPAYCFFWILGTSTRFKRLAFLQLEKWATSPSSRTSSRR